MSAFLQKSTEAQQQARMWENDERASYQAQHRNFEHRDYQEAAQEKLNVEAASRFIEFQTKVVHFCFGLVRIKIPLLM